MIIFESPEGAGTTHFQQNMSPAELVSQVHSGFLAPRDIISTNCCRDLAGRGIYNMGFGERVEIEGQRRYEKNAKYVCPKFSILEKA